VDRRRRLPAADPVTDRLYYADSYLTRFSASVVDHADGGRRVYLDRTAFYPTSGGQPFDTGILGGVTVTDVVDEEDRIAHVLAQPLETGQVEGEVDWTRRFDHMQQHTGQHLLSAVLVERFGWPTVSVHFGPDASTLDLEVAAVTPEQVAAAERDANALVTANRRVTVSFEDATDAAGLRKASSRPGTLRIVTIERLDRSACGGTHVRATGEIGPVLIRRVERVKKQTRLEFLCGTRAVDRARKDYALLSRLAGLFSAPVDDVGGLVEGVRANLKTAAASRKLLEEALAAFQVKDLAARTPADASGLRRLAFAASSADQLRATGQAATALERAVLVGSLADPPTLLYATSPDSGVDAGAALKPLLAELGGRGGGSPRMAQGSVPNAEALAEAVRRLMA
jgi:alanyl-tRNA synthetase